MFFEFWGARACFTRPELKAERYSYDVPTPSAVRGMISAIYWHPSIEWKIDKIYVLNPIRDENIKRNELKGKLSADIVLKALNTNKISDISMSVDATTIMQRTSRILCDVHYVVEAHFIFTSAASSEDTSGKVISIVQRRLEKGQCFNTPYLGCREFSASFGEWPRDKQIPAIGESRDFGLMLYDLDYSDPSNIMPIYYHSVMVNGVIDVQNAEVYR